MAPHKALALANNGPVPFELHVRAMQSSGPSCFDSLMFSPTSKALTSLEVRPWPLRSEDSAKEFFHILTSLDNLRELSVKEDDYDVRHHAGPLQIPLDVSMHRSFVGLWVLPTIHGKRLPAIRKLRLEAMQVPQHQGLDNGLQVFDWSAIEHLRLQHCTVAPILHSITSSGCRLKRLSLGGAIAADSRAHLVASHSDVYSKLSATLCGLLESCDRLEEVVIACFPNMDHSWLHGPMIWPRCEHFELRSHGDYTSSIAAGAVSMLRQKAPNLKTLVLESGTEDRPVSVNPKFQFVL